MPPFPPSSSPRATRDREGTTTHSGESQRSDVFAHLPNSHGDDVSHGAELFDDVAHRNSSLRETTVDYDLSGLDGSKMHSDSAVESGRRKSTQV